ncbi:YncE family protein [Saccharopolyspora flava]|uniref:DNA-binding beta-propeller fold protein YncE n=1 Tax=Saccharopolyspora flava TaxID=95161 RepID=A0A1I6PQX8_9PSEU|nr:surface layer protein [Saccharopolyspora flava]SFS42632.1 DNA-binding beta-propeller fold protein YncE [Saccharopolyspora flava]
MANADLLAVVSQSGPTVTFFNAETHEVHGVLEVPAEPHELCFDPDQRLLYCTIAYRGGYYHANEGRATELVVIDPDERRIVQVVDLSPEHAPHGLALDRERGLLYVSVEEGPAGSGGLVVLDTATREVTGRIDTEAPGPHWFAITPDGRRGYAANKEAGFVSSVDLTTGAPHRIPVPGSEGIAVSPDGAEIFVAAPYGGGEDRGTPGIRVIDTASDEVVRTIPADHQVFPVHVTSRGLLLTGEVRTSSDPVAFGDQGAGLLSVHRDGQRIGQIDVGRLPLTIASSPDGHRAWVSAVSSSTVSVVDLDDLSVVATLPIPRRGEPGAHGLAFIPAS